jgi:hypothetical protein
VSLLFGRVQGKEAVALGRTDRPLHWGNQGGDDRLPVGTAAIRYQHLALPGSVRRVVSHDLRVKFWKEGVPTHTHTPTHTSTTLTCSARRDSEQEGGRFHSPHMRRAQAPYSSVLAHGISPSMPGHRKPTSSFHTGCWRLLAE